MEESQKVALRLELFKQAFIFKQMKPDADVVAVFKASLRLFPELVPEKKPKKVK